MQINLNTINLILLCLISTGCSKVKTQESESTTPKIDTATQAPPPTTTQSQSPKKTKTTYNGTYEAIMNNPSLGKTQPLHLKLQEGNFFTAYPSHEPKNKTHGNWKVEGGFLICTGTTEQTKRRYVQQLERDRTTQGSANTNRTCQHPIKPHIPSRKPTHATRLAASRPAPHRPRSDEPPHRP